VACPYHAGGFVEGQTAWNLQHRNPDGAGQGRVVVPNLAGKVRRLGLGCLLEVSIARNPFLIKRKQAKHVVRPLRCATATQEASLVWGLATSGTGGPTGAPRAPPRVQRRPGTGMRARVRIPVAAGTTRTACDVARVVLAFCTSRRAYIVVEVLCCMGGAATVYAAKRQQSVQNRKVWK
jgi:hypothetical protein